MALRHIHAYLIAFVAPTILFFALTGALQIFSLHESHGGYTPPPLIENLARVHKDQVFAAPRRHRVVPLQTPVARPEGDWVAPAPEHDNGQPPPGPKVLALTALFLVAAIMLVVATLLGLWMAFTQNRRKVVLLLLFLAGAALPIALAAI